MTRQQQAEMPMSHDTIDLPTGEIVRFPHKTRNVTHHLLGYRHPHIEDIQFDSEIDIKKIVTWGFAPTHFWRLRSMIFQIQSFKDSGFSSIMRPDGTATGYSIATWEFMKYFKEKNRWMTGFTAGHGRPSNQGEYDFWNPTYDTIGTAYFIDVEWRKAQTSLYLIWKGGEGVLTGEKLTQALAEIMS